MNDYDHVMMVLSKKVSIAISLMLYGSRQFFEAAGTCIMRGPSGSGSISKKNAEINPAAVPKARLSYKSKM